MFDFLKKIFVKDEPVEIKEEGVPLKSLDKWFDSIVENKRKIISKKVTELNEEKAELITSINEKLEAFKTLELRNPNIPIKEKQFMEGSRTSYILRTGIFLRNIGHTIVSDDASFFCKDYETKLSEFSKSTIRAYSILQNFFSDEIREVAALLKQIDTSVLALKSLLDKEKIDNISQARDAIRHMQDNIKHKSKLEKRIAELSDEEHLLKLNIEKLEKDKLSVKSSDNYSEFIKLNEELESKNKLLRDLDLKMFHHYSVLETALKKYERITADHASLIKEILTKPVITFCSKIESINKMLTDLGRSVSSGSLSLKDKKKEKTLETINLLTNEYLSDFKENRDKIKEQISKIKSDIKNNSCSAKLESTKEEIKLKEDSLKSISRKLSEAKSEFEAIDPEKDKLDAEKILSDVSGTVVDIEI